MRNLDEIRDIRYNDVPNNLKSKRCKKKLEKVISEPDNTKIVNEYNHENVKTNLKKYHANKCVYCEDEPVGTSFIRIDHFRPKSLIKGIEKNRHLGYYWLGYEWTNLLQSCELCNNSKSNHFPLKREATRVSHNTIENISDTSFNALKAPLIQEERLLLNPEIDNVEQHFKVLIDGDITSSTEEGKKSLEVFDLKRDLLKIGRLKIINRELTDIRKAIKRYNKLYIISKDAAHDQLFDDLKSSFTEWLFNYKKRERFSFVYFNLFHRFQYFIQEDEILINEEHILIEMYNEFKKLN